MVATMPKKKSIPFEKRTNIRIIGMILSTVFIVLIQIATSDEEANAVVYHWKIDEYPILTTKPKLCTGSHRNPPTNVCDPDEILTPSEAQELDNLIYTEQNHTVCLCDPCPEKSPNGLLIKVALALSLDIAANETIERAVEHFAERTRLKWDWAKHCHHDVLIVAVTTYNQVHISMGAKAERVVGRKQAISIVNDARKKFSSNYVFEGLKEVITAVHSEARSYNPRLDKLGLRGGFLLWTIIALIAIILIVTGVWIYFRCDSKASKKRRAKESWRESPEKGYEFVADEN